MHTGDVLYWYSAVCNRVVDGDTLDLTFDLGMHVHIKERVRVYGIDTPEIYGVKKDSEEYERGCLASARVKELIEGKRIWVNTKKDKYGRYLAIIFYEDDNGASRSLAQTLVAEGLAKLKE